MPGKRTTKRKPAEEALLALSQIKQRGWNEAMISELLGEPDAERSNPHHRSGPPMRLYKTKRVERVEKSVKFLELQARRSKRREGAQKAVVTKRKELADYASQVRIEIPSLAEDELIRRACSDYNGNQIESGGERASPNSKPEFLARICVNYLRHCMSCYELQLAKIAGRVGASDEYITIKSKVLDAIAGAYEWLWDEAGVVP